MNKVVNTLFLGKEKAWGSSVVVFVMALLLQKINGGEVDPAAIANFTNLTTELLVAGVGGGITYFITWVTGNTPKTETTPVDA